MFRIILSLGLFIGGCAIDFHLPFDGISSVGQRCNDGDPCTADFDTWRLGVRHDTILTCWFPVLSDCIPNRCDTMQCSDESYCTEDYCDSLTGCSHNLYCDDDDACTVDNCINYSEYGTCQHIAVNCNDLDACTYDNCSEKDGHCLNTDTCGFCPFDTLIDPAYNDYCKVIVCVNGVIFNTPRSCNDGNACTNDVCFSETCYNFPVNCDDGGGGAWWCEPVNGKGMCFYGACDDFDECTWDIWSDVTELCEFTSLCKMDESESGFLFIVSPNPFVTSTEVKFTTSERAMLTVHDVTGKELLRSDKPVTFTIATSGVYFARLVTESGDVYVRKIVAQ